VSQILERTFFFLVLAAALAGCYLIYVDSPSSIVLVPACLGLSAASRLAQSVRERNTISIGLSVAFLLVAGAMLMLVLIKAMLR
jgi:hypothetical protein